MSPAASLFLICVFTFTCGIGLTAYVAYLFLRWQQVIESVRQISLKIEALTDVASKQNEYNQRLIAVIKDLETAVEAKS